MTHEPYDAFELRHIGPRGDDVERMLGIIGAPSIDDLVDEVGDENRLVDRIGR